MLIYFKAQFMLLNFIFNIQPSFEHTIVSMRFFQKTNNPFFF